MLFLKLSEDPIISFQAYRTLSGSQHFFENPLADLLKTAIATDANDTVLQFYKQVAGRVPAYKNFLEQQGINPPAIETFADFQQLPLLTKENYCQAFPLAQRCWLGRLETCDLLAMSSGSTGNPTVWPRSIGDEYAIAQRFEQVFRDSFQAKERRTLAVVCFPMGTWVGGLFTTNCCRHVANKGYPITVIAPGNQPSEILRVVKALGPEFEQVVLLGYPPFIKTVVDQGLNQGFDWSALKPKLVLAGEVFSEEWRTLMGDRLGMANVVTDTASLYGTADAGVLGNETPLSITIRRFLATRPELSQALFGQERLPTLVQYDPTQRFFEVQNGSLLFSGDSSVPLIRYHIADTGGIISYADLMAFLKQHGFDPLRQLPNPELAYALPFVYVFSRANFVLSFYGANLYPENVAIGLEQPEIRDQVTGKFVMAIDQDPDQNPYLAIAVECAANVNPTDLNPSIIAQTIKDQICRLNSEFAHYVPTASQFPRISLHPLGDPTYFPPGVKHRYTR